MNNEIVLLDPQDPGPFAPLLSDFEPVGDQQFIYGYVVQGYAAGVLAVEIYDAFAQIRHLYVSESFRRMKIADTLLSEVMERLFSCGIEEVSACVSLSGHARRALDSFFLSRGFTEDPEMNNKTDAVCYHAVFNRDTDNDELLEPPPISLDDQ